MMCVFSQQYYVCLTHYLVDEIGRFLSTKIPILYNKLSKTSTTYQHVILSTLKNVNRFIFRNFWCFINSMYVPVVTLSVTFFSHIQKHKNGGKVNIVASCSTFSKYLPLFSRGKGGSPCVYHKLFKTILLTSHSLPKNFKDCVFSIISLSHSLGNFSQLSRYVLPIFSLTPAKILGLICYL